MAINNSLFENFNSISDDEWRNKVIQDLKGKDFQTTLVWEDENNIHHQPYYRKSATEENETISRIENSQSKAPSWRFVREFSSTTESLEKQVRKAKSEGIDEAVINNIEDFKQAKALFSESIKEVPHLHLYLKKIDHEAPTKTIFCDPIGEMVKQERIDTQEMKALKNLFQKRLNQLNPDNFLLVNGSIYKNAGATIVDELALTLHHAVEYLDQLTEAGYRADAIARSFTFKLGFGMSYFSEIAKARAFRYLIQKVYQAYKVEAKVRVWGEASSYYHSHKDPYNNLVRLTTQCMSAAVGNCDLISLPAFDNWESPSNLGNRMSKNISLILKEESYFNKVQDMAKGSYYLETLSHDIANKAWKRFLELEKKGGILSLLKNGDLANLLAEESKKRAEAYKKNKRILVGFNKYENKEAKDLKIKLEEVEGITAKLISKDVQEK